MGWSFSLKTSAGAQVGTITTAPLPDDYCRDLAPGTYRAEEVTQTGWTKTDPTGAPPQKPFTIVSGQTTTLVFGNQLTPPAPAFSIQKFNDSGPTACGPNGVNNPCVFPIRITNIGTAPYSGPASFSDSMRVLNLPPAPNSMALVSVGPAGWSCSATGAPMTCTGPVSLAVGQSVDVAVTFKFSHPVRPTRNCVTLTAPAVLPEVCITLQADDQPPSWTRWILMQDWAALSLMWLQAQAAVPVTRAGRDPPPPMEGDWRDGRNIT